VILTEEVLPGVIAIWARLDGVRCCNSWLVDKILIDPVLFSSEEMEMWRGLDKSMNQIVLTHWHWDHFRGAIQIAKVLNIPIVAPKHRRHFANSIIADGNHIGRWNVIAAPGHSIDHIVLFDGETLIAGDTISSDNGAFSVLCKSEKEMRDTHAKLVSLNTKVILPGHGDIIREPEKAFSQCKYIIY
jgi:glyoxylase-like metal-dependent hydrolase (beta-lactamase superfamily II)